MPMIVPLNDFDAKESDTLNFRQFTQQEVQAICLAQPSISPWHVIRMQVGIGALVTLLAWGLTLQPAVAWSAAYGALAVLVPAMLFARGLMAQTSSVGAPSAWTGFFVWEAAKIALSVAMLVAAPKVVADLNWLAMLAGLVLTLKVYWVALVMRPKPKQKI